MKEKTIKVQSGTDRAWSSKEAHENGFLFCANGGDSISPQRKLLIECACRIIGNFIDPEMGAMHNEAGIKKLAAVSIQMAVAILDETDFL